jgi:hypothetical protein
VWAATRAAAARPPDSGQDALMEGKAAPTRLADAPPKPKHERTVML